ncbi:MULTISPECIES: CAP domain-containing protein [Sphingobacterium]|uniref:CAP domain-containing protein n=1 Tax=Sphingobacterium TaxID=28453 RepID=UPI0013DC0106|nr:MULTISPECIES: CAP domain-containing protein [unclassified Sphingobacterium]
MRIILFLLLISTSSIAQNRTITTDKQQAKEAYLLLNEIRMHPEKYAKQLGISPVGKVKKTKLVWNETLAKAAEFRAYDMAQRNYFDHVTPEGLGPNYYIAKAGYSLNPDWIKKKSANNFESIAANHATATDGIRAFIVGKESPGFMHRKHVLGMDEWNGSLMDIGIGFVHAPTGSTYKTYLCVIIAKHDW